MLVVSPLPSDNYRLLMLRKAGASFNSAFNIRSVIFETMLNEYAMAGKDLERLRERLLIDLHAAVPCETRQPERRLLLKIKRAVFNRRAVPAAGASGLPEPLRQNINSYNTLLETRATLLNSKRQAVFSELRGKLSSLIQDERFRAALDYSCPWLVDAYRDKGPGDERRFSDEERGIHAYATKFFSKANPFYTFASAGIPEASGLGAGCEYEVILDTSLILAIERRLLELAQDSDRRLLYLRSYLYQSNSFRFLTMADDKMQVVSVKDHPLLRCVLEFFERRSVEPSVSACVDYILEGLHSNDRLAVENYVRLLIRQGILVEYLVKDFENFGENLSGLSQQYDPIISELQRVHMKCISSTELSAVHNRLSGISLPEIAESGALPEPLYYINAYDCGDLKQHKGLAEHIHEELSALKQFFTISYFDDHAYVARHFLLDQLGRCAEGKATFLEMLFEFLRGYPEIVARYHPTAHLSREAKQRNFSWLQRLANCSGDISREDLFALLRERPETEAGERNLCFLGSFDYVKGTFYLGSVFAGDGRFSSRYLLHNGPKRYRQPLSEDNWLDVQLVAPFKGNRTYVAAEYPTGCGFEARYGRHFEQWLDPLRIVIESRDGRVIYRDGVSGRMLRFHFFGFVLAQYLPAAYQLLLADHADAYLIPFANLSLASPRDLPGEREAKHIPALYFGSVCLRREQYVFLQRAFEAICKEDDILVCTVMLREKVHLNTGMEEDEWYFRTIEPGKNSKPRYLDLRNPLSVHTFRRAVAPLQNGAMIYLARMEPSAAAAFKQGQEAFTTEAMIEV